MHGAYYTSKFSQFHVYCALDILNNMHVTYYRFESTTQRIMSSSFPQNFCQTVNLDTAQTTHFELPSLLIHSPIAISRLNMEKIMHFLAVNTMLSDDLHF